MTLEDPFFVVKDEVSKALNKTRGLYGRWAELQDVTVTTPTVSSGIPVSREELEWTTTELRNALRSIEWDLEDLEDTICIVEKNPSKFKIDNKELTVRRHFIEQTREEVKVMKDKMHLSRGRDRDRTARQGMVAIHYTCSITDLQLEILHENGKFPTWIVKVPFMVLVPAEPICRMPLLDNSPARVPVSHSTTKYSKLENEIDSPNRQFLDSTLRQQDTMIREQDEQLEMIGESIETLKTVSRQINTELDEQAVMLDDFGNELEATDSKLDATMKKMAKVLHMSNDRRQWVAIGVLTAILIVLIILFIIK